MNQDGEIGRLRPEAEDIIAWDEVANGPIPGGADCDALGPEPSTYGGTKPRVICARPHGHSGLHMNGSWEWAFDEWGDEARDG